MIATILIILSSLCVVAAAVLQVLTHRLLFPKAPGSAITAKARLHAVLDADRKLMPAGCWMPRVRGVFHLGKQGQLPFKVKPRWRWVSR